MRPLEWNPPVELSATEAKIISKIGKAKLFIWLRQNRHKLFDQEIQEELAKIYIAKQAGAEIVSGSSLKAALDRDWDDLEAKKEALGTILQTLTQVESWVAAENLETEEAQENLQVARQIETQDVEVTPVGITPLGARANSLSQGR